MLTQILGILSGALAVFRVIADFVTAEKLKKSVLNEQLLKQAIAREKIEKAADEARKNPPSGNIIDHL